MIIALDQLAVRRRGEPDQTAIPGTGVSIGRSGGDDYWAYRVDLTDKQALIGFPKHGTVGVDFLHNHGSDLPYGGRLERHADFIADGRLLGGDEAIPRAHVIRALSLIRDAVAADRDGPRCAGACQSIKNAIYWGDRDPADDPTAGLDPHWVEDCPLPDDDAPSWEFDGERDADGWPIEDEDDED